MEPEGSLPCSQQPATSPYPEYHFMTKIPFTLRNFIPTPNPQAVKPPIIGCPRLLIQYIRSFRPYLGARIAQSVYRLATGSTTEGFESRYGQEFSFLHVIQTGSGHIQPAIQWEPGALSPGVTRPGREADHIQIVPRWRKYEAIHPLPNTPSWRSA
jgi:hypothetical protein